MNRNCPHCGREFTAAKAVMRHIKGCGGPTKVPRWKYRSTHHKEVGRGGSKWTDNEQSWSKAARSEEIDPPVGYDNLVDDNENGHIYLQDHGAPLLEEGLEMETTTIPAFPRSAPTLSSGSHTIVETYIEVEGRHWCPGRPVTEAMAIPRAQKSADVPLYSPLPVQPMDKLPPELFTPFRSVFEYKLCLWLFKNHTTASSMKSYFENNMEPWRGLSEIRSVKMFKEVLHRIPYGIAADDVMERKIGLSLPDDCGSLEYTVRYRSIIAIIQFLIGHEPFKENLAYAPVRLYKDSEKQTPIWNEMHTGSWWWDTQKSLPPNSTIVPVILSSDKTLMTQHGGDKSSHPVYVTIGNLDKVTRRSQTRPSKILLGFLPIPTKSHANQIGLKHLELKRIVYNQAMAVMTESLPRAESEGMLMRCADGNTRICYPIIGGFVADYEEQVLISGVKSGQHCVLCQIPPHLREALIPLERYPLRTHGYTQTCIRRMRLKKAHRLHKRLGARALVSQPLRTHEAAHDGDPSMQVDDVESFMWRFRRSNMHEIMQIDLLHQLFKGVVHRALTDWVYSALKRDRGEAQTDAILDQRFGCVPPFPELKTGIVYSTITQWTGAEQKCLLRQLVPALAPIISTPKIQFIRALVDFTLHAQYYSHDADTLSWMEAALERIDILKEAFRDFTAAETGFNIPKLHAITHYPMMIRKFGSADGFNTETYELSHRLLLKDWYKLTNKHETYEAQIMEHNQRIVNMLAMEDLFDYRLKETLLPGQKEDRAQVTAVTTPEDLDSLRWVAMSQGERDRIEVFQRMVPTKNTHPHLKRGAKYWRCASTVAQYSELPNFVDALAVFVREEQRRLAGDVTNNRALNQKERDVSSVREMLVCVHPSLLCWKADRDDGSNADILRKEIVRCDPCWQARLQWRRDCVWIQEYTQNKLRPHPLQGRLPGQLLIIISVLDTTSPLEGVAYPVYTGALVDVYMLKNKGLRNESHGMIEAQRQSFPTDPRSRSLGHQRIYHLGLILRSAHLIPVSSSRKDDFYINAYADWEQYATVYDPEFLEKDIKTARRIQKEYGLRR